MNEHEKSIVNYWDKIFGDRSDQVNFDPYASLSFKNFLKFYFILVPAKAQSKNN